MTTETTSEPICVCSKPMWWMPQQTIDMKLFGTYPRCPCCGALCAEQGMTHTHVTRFSDVVALPR